MHVLKFLTFITFTAAFFSCEKSYTISTNKAHYIPEKHLTFLDSQDVLPPKLNDFLATQANKGKLIKFPLAYYLIQEQDIRLIFNEKIDSKISDQLYMTVSGIKYYKLFVHPDVDTAYTFLKNAYRYIGPDQTEFFATSLDTPKTIIVWSQGSNTRLPFIVHSYLQESPNSPTKTRVPALSLDQPSAWTFILKRELAKGETRNPVEGQRVMSVPTLSR